MGKFFIDECLICKQKIKKNEWIVNTHKVSWNPLLSEQFVHLDCLKSKK
jgi:hypothetical protein